MSAAPAGFAIDLYQGATWRETFTWQTGDPAVNVDLTGCTARLQVRATVNSPIKLIELTTENGGITLGGTSGTIELHFAPADTEGANWRDGVYDLEIVMGGGYVRRLLSGVVLLDPEVTRD